MVETRIAYIERLNNGIIRVETKKDVMLETEDLDENFDVFLKMQENEKELFLIVFGVGGESNFESRIKFAELRRSRIKKAEALVVRSLSHRIESNFYKNYFKLPHPVEVFDDEEKAVEWLLSQ
jgi:hypothetical protein